MWRWESQGDGRVLRLFQDKREVLVIDRTRLHIVDRAGVTGFDTVVGQGEHPTFEDEKLILKSLNGGEMSSKPPDTNLDYKVNSWLDFSIEELGQWVALLVKRSGHRTNPDDAAKDLHDAYIYLDMIRAKVQAQQSLLGVKV